MSYDKNAHAKLAREIKNVFEMFKQRYPNIEVLEYHVIDHINDTNDSMGILVTTTYLDHIIYFPYSKLGLSYLVGDEVAYTEFEIDEDSYDEDEDEHEMIPVEKKAVITYVNGYLATFDGIHRNGRHCPKHNLLEVHKTGKHFDSLDAFIRQGEKHA